MGVYADTCMTFTGQISPSHTLGCAASQLQKQAGRRDQVLLFCCLGLNVPLKIVLSSNTEHLVQPTESDLYSTSCPLLSHQPLNK